jgi:hypothetical protein
VYVAGAGGSDIVNRRFTMSLYGVILQVINVWFYVGMRMYANAWVQARHALQNLTIRGTRASQEPSTLFLITASKVFQNPTRCPFILVHTLV